MPILDVTAFEPIIVKVRGQEYTVDDPNQETMKKLAPLMSKLESFGGKDGQVSPSKLTDMLEVHMQILSILLKIDIEEVRKFSMRESRQITEFILDALYSDIDKKEPSEEEKGGEASSGSSEE